MNWWREVADCLIAVGVGAGVGLVVYWCGHGVVAVPAGMAAWFFLACRAGGGSLPRNDP